MLLKMEEVGTPGKKIMEKCQQSKAEKGLNYYSYKS
jgi:hypothetical protein